MESIRWRMDASSCRCPGWPVTDRPNLTPFDWTIAGIAALAEGGVDAVRVERLAKRLGASKGSFYWHFADRPALLQSMLALWEPKAK